MTNLLKIALIGGGAYLAYNYLQKRKKNQVVEKAMLEEQSQLAKKEGAIVEAAMEEMGEEGMAVAMGNDAELAKLAQSGSGWDNASGASRRQPAIKLNADGWDSDTLV